MPNQKIRVHSCGTYLPDQVIRSVDLFEEIKSETNYGVPKNWMIEKMGIEERRSAPDDAKPSDLAIPAARRALETLDGVNADEIDMIVFCGIERDQPEPATAHVIQNALGLNARHAFDIANACFGFINGMELAANYIKSGTARYALVVTGETPTKILNKAVEALKQGVEKDQYMIWVGALTVGDAGGAVVLGPSDSSCGFDLFNTETESIHVDKCIYRPTEDGSYEGQMLMGPITIAFLRAQQRMISDTLERLGWPKFDWLLTHQIGAKPFERLSRLPGVKPEIMIKTFHKLGNITTATFPVGYDKLQKSGKLKAGDHVGGCFAGSGLALGQFGYTC